MENQMSDLSDNNGTAKKFPVGMSVLAVDNDLIFLKELETLLVKCEYQVSTTNQAIKALEMLRENRNKFDLIISEVNMPDMDGFKFLELVGLEMNHPFIMMSAHSDTGLVMKAVTNGACDYLLKPLRMEELKHIWQHVVRRKKFTKKDQTKPSQVEKANNKAGEWNTRKPRVIWSPEQHKKFVDAIYEVGLRIAVPRKVLEMMNVEGLTCGNVASHLQRYRLYLGRPDLKAEFVDTLRGTMQQLSLKNNADQSKMQGKKRKDQGEDRAEDGEDKEPENKKAPWTPRAFWSLELHKKFVAAIDQLGLEKAVPKKIFDLMNDEELTTESVASHLQKYRIYCKKRAQQAEMADALSDLKRLKIVSAL